MSHVIALYTNGFVVTCSVLDLDEGYVLLVSDGSEAFNGGMDTIDGVLDQFSVYLQSIGLLNDRLNCSLRFVE